LVRRSADRTSGVDADELVLAGYPQVGRYGDAIVRRSVLEFVGPACVVSTIVAWICIRRLSLTVVILAVSGLAAGWSVAIVTLSGAKWGGLSSVIPTLAYVLTVSGSMHLINYSRAVGTPSARPERLFRRVMRVGWKPCLLSTLTTAAGMISLCRSDFPAIRAFGVYCAAGVMASLVCQLLFIPLAIDWLQPKHLASLDEHTPSRLLDRLLRRPAVAVCLFVATAVGCGLGLSRLSSDLEVERNFSASAPVMQDIAWFETHVGPVDQTELLITFSGVTASGFDTRLRLIRDIESRLVRLPQIDAVLSAAAWLPPPPRGRSIAAVAARSAYGRSVQNRRAELQRTRYLRIDGQSERWRISLRFPFFGAADFTRMKTEIPNVAVEKIDSVMPRADVTVDHTGVALL